VFSKSGFTLSDLLQETYSVCPKISKSEWFFIAGMLTFPNDRHKKARRAYALRALRTSSDDSGITDGEFGGAGGS